MHLKVNFLLMWQLLSALSVGGQARIVGGRELIIKSIEIETEEDQTTDSNNK